MTNLVNITIHNHIGFIQLNRPKALNALTLDMVRSITQALLAWETSEDVRAVVIHSDNDRAFCAGGDIRFFYEAGQENRALLEDFFTEEYRLNFLIHQYPKPYIALLDGIVMGGGMGIGQAGPNNQLRIVTERTKMAMPEVNIGLFPDVGGSYFLSRCVGEVGSYLGLTGETIGAADAIYANLADVYLPSQHIPAFFNYLQQTKDVDLRLGVRHFLSSFQEQLPKSQLAQDRDRIDQHFSHHSLTQIRAALTSDTSTFALHTLNIMQTRSPLMMCVTLSQLRRGKRLSIAECLRMERTMMHHCLNYPEVFEGIRALVIDKDKRPKWQPSKLEEVDAELIQQFFTPVWPDYAHPLKELSV